MNTGEDINALRKIIDMTRLVSAFILAIHFYLACYTAFHSWGLTAEITDRIVSNVAKVGLFSSMLRPKLFSLLLLAVSAGLFFDRINFIRQLLKDSVFCWDLIYIRG